MNRGLAGTGDTETGVTIMEVVPALDAGAMVSKGAVTITDKDTTQITAYIHKFDI